MSVIRPFPFIRPACADIQYAFHWHWTAINGRDSKLKLGVGELTQVTQSSARASHDNTRDSFNEKKFTESIDMKIQSCVNENQVSLGETMFTKKVVDACYNLSSTGQRHGSGGLECH